MLYWKYMDCLDDKKKIRENLKFVCFFTFFNAFFNGQKDFKVNALYIM